MLLVYLNAENKQMLCKFNGIEDFLEESKKPAYEELQQSNKVLCLTKDVTFNEQMSYNQLLQAIISLNNQGIFVHEYKTKKFKSMDWWLNLTKEELDKAGVLEALKEELVQSTIMQILCNFEDLTDILDDSIKVEQAQQRIVEAIGATFCDKTI